MVSEARARELADDFAKGEGCKVGPAVTELEQGWYFAWEKDGHIGSHGFVVNKLTGNIFMFGSAFPIERDLHMYDQGMDADTHDVVILKVADRAKTLAMLVSLAPTVIELSYEAGTVWKIPRKLSERELKARLKKLPAIFPGMHLYFRFEEIEEARSNKCCVLEVLPNQPL